MLATKDDTKREGVADGKPPTQAGIVGIQDISMRQIGGFALLSLWMFVLFYSTKPFLAFENPVEALYLSGFISVAVMACTLLGIAAVVRRQARVYRNPPFIWEAMVAMVVGSAITSAIDPLVNENTLLLGVGGALTGAGSSVLFLAWFELIAQQNLRSASFTFALGYCIAFLAGLIGVLLPDPVVLAGTIALPVASTVLLMKEAGHAQKPDKMKPFVAFSVGTKCFFAKMLAGLMLFGILQGFMDWFTGYWGFTNIPYDNVNIRIWGFIFMLAAAFAIVLRRGDAFPFIYKLVMVCFFMGGMLLVLDEDLRFWSSGVFFAGYSLLLVVLAVICMKVFDSFQMGLTRCGAVAFGILYLGETIGSSIAATLSFSAIIAPGVAVGLAMMTGVVMVHMFLFTETDFVRIGLGELDTVAPPGIDSAEEDSLNKGRENTFIQTSAVMKKRFGLSPREGEVLPLLLQGRTIARIQETLYISQGTVSTHVRHIYQKTGVEDRQALLDLAEKISRE